MKFGSSCGVGSVCLYGGAPKGRQLAQLRNRPQICIATPGRLNDLLESRMIDMSTATYVVLDEADRMLDMGFEPQIRKILQHVPVDRQTLFFTATWPKAVIRVATDTPHAFATRPDARRRVVATVAELVGDVSKNDDAPTVGAPAGAAS